MSQTRLYPDLDETKALKVLEKSRNFRLVQGGKFEVQTGYDLSDEEWDAYGYLLVEFDYQFLTCDINREEEQYTCLS